MNGRSEYVCACLDVFIIEGFGQFKMSRLYMNERAGILYISGIV